MLKQSVDGFVLSVGMYLQTIGHDITEDYNIDSM